MPLLKKKALTAKDEKALGRDIMLMQQGMKPAVFQREVIQTKLNEFPDNLTLHFANAISAFNDSDCSGGKGLLPETGYEKLRTALIEMLFVFRYSEEFNREHTIVFIRVYYNYLKYLFNRLQECRAQETNKDNQNELDLKLQEINEMRFKQLNKENFAELQVLYNQQPKTRRMIVEKKELQSGDGEIIRAALIILNVFAEIPVLTSYTTRMLALIPERDPDVVLMKKNVETIMLQTQYKHLRKALGQGNDANPQVAAAASALFDHCYNVVHYPLDKNRLSLTQYRFSNHQVSFQLRSAMLKPFYLAVSLALSYDTLIKPDNPPAVATFKTMIQKTQVLLDILEKGDEAEFSEFIERSRDSILAISNAFKWGLDTKSKL